MKDYVTHEVVLNGPINDETNLTQRTYFVTRVYTDGSGHRTSVAHFFNASNQKREVRNWDRLAQLARIVDERSV